MTRSPDPLTAFADLRRAAVEYAQEASGDIWTDYNLHDPGVTLLEQTCFALSQVAWQAGLPVRDLLTNPRGHFCFHDLALFRPRKVLGSMPVRREDLQTWIGTCPGIERVVIAPHDPARPGRLDVILVPSGEEDAGVDAVGTFRALFRRARPLCTDLGSVVIARPLRVVLHGEVEITEAALPETVAAALYHQVSDILSGASRADHAARRADVWEAPERLLAPARSDVGKPGDISEHLNDLRALPGVRDIGAFSLRQPGTREMPAAGDAVFYRSVLPRTRDQIGLTLTLNGAAVALDPARIREEYNRIAAETIAAAVHHVDGPDWDVMRPGRRRQFGQSHVDSLLPGLYRAEGYSMHDPGDLISEYREAIDGVLRDMIADLDALPRIFTARPHQKTDDPVAHRMRVKLLDYLIALQGAEMPATRHSGLHHYMSVRARHRFAIEWRLEYLFALPWLNSARATGPGPEGPGGFLAELAILADLNLTENSDQTSVLRRFGLHLDDSADPVAQDDDRIIMVGALNPFDMLVPLRDHAERLSPERLAELSPFVTDGALCSADFRRLADADSLAIVPYPGGSWQVLYDPGNGTGLQRCAVIRDKDEAMETVARLRATWNYLHRASEAAHLSERIILEEDGSGSAHTADLMLPGWTARCAMQSFRNYVEGLVAQLAPAHIHVRVHWQDFDASERTDADRDSPNSAEPEQASDTEQVA
ncbi:hypothetical protein [uncultured Roseobacter sp.]|uniref:hypothetical protein n=1 Tax=uncultured Roseobacter sp. TaxID=114847 RepID=UPI00262BF10E|nr:hypothetical protein [uncultured Roseobacter sp.]